MNTLSFWHGTCFVSQINGFQQAMSSWHQRIRIKKNGFANSKCHAILRKNSCFPFSLDAWTTRSSLSGMCRSYPTMTGIWTTLTLCLKNNTADTGDTPQVLLPCCELLSFIYIKMSKCEESNSNIKKEDSVNKQ